MTLVGGIYEFSIGVNSFEEAIPFWESCGYRVGPRGSLTSSKTKELYGLDSSLESIRMLHQNADSGLIRLMKWEKVIGPGLNMAPLRTFGCRWSVHKTDNIANAYIHGRILKEQGKPIHLVGPDFNLDLEKNFSEKKPFIDHIAASGDVLLFQPEAQLVAMTRINFEVPKYGTINLASPLRLSEGCHMAIVFHGNDLKIFDFYEEIIGFKRYQEISIDYKAGYMPSDMFDLKPGESFTEVDFDNPIAGDHPKEHLPGRLRCFLVRSSEIKLN